MNESGHSIKKRSAKHTPCGPDLDLVAVEPTVELEGLAAVEVVVGQVMAAVAQMGGRPNGFGIRGAVLTQLLLTSLLLMAMSNDTL